MESAYPCENVSFVAWETVLKIIDSLEFHIEEPTAVAIGKFDGIHLGHMELLKYVLRKKDDGFKAVVFTFEPSAAVFFGGKDIKEVTTRDEKRLIFEEMGIDYLVEFPLSSETASIEADIFVKDILCEKLNMKYIAAGTDISFGYKGLGNVELLKELANVYLYQANIIDKVMYEGREISSTYVREEIAKGDMKTVEALLGHPYSFAGTVEYGFKLGRKLGFPTMNQYPDALKILPPLGVYYSNVSYDGTVYHGLTNIGRRPTVAACGDEHISIETYLYDFDMDMYGKNIVTQLLEFKRPEMKFDSKEHLSAQIQQDLEDGREYDFG